MADPGQLEGSTAIITGGGSGIGRALCLGLAQEGAAIAVADIRLPEAQATVAEVQERGGNATAIQVDVAQSTSVDAMVQAALEVSGRIDILINCAGIFPRHSVVEMSEEEWRHVLDVNLTGTFLCCKAVAGPMMAQGGPHAASTYKIFPTSSTMTFHSIRKSMSIASGAPHGWAPSGGPSLLSPRTREIT